MRQSIVASDLLEGQETFWSFVRLACGDLVKDLIEWGLRRLQHQGVGVGWHERSRRRSGYRNGTYTRKLVTPEGPVKVKVPRIRGASLLTRAVFDRYQQRCDDVDRVLRQAYLMGLSTGDAAELGGQLFGQDVSRQTISALGRWLDVRLQMYRQMPILGHYPVVQLDGMYVTVGGRKKVIVVAMGIQEDGTKHVLGFSLGRGESCRDLLWDLRERGLEGVEVFVTDDSGPIRSALEEVYPEVPKQVCVWHLLQNLHRRLKGADHRLKMLLGASRIFRCVSLEAALEETERWTRRWGPHEEETVGWFLDVLGDSLNFYHMPEPWWKRTRTTSLTERLIGKLRRRLNLMGAFANAAAADRAVFGQLLRWRLVPEITHKA
mgnify:CR=1 FL=1